MCWSVCLSVPGAGSAVRPTCLCDSEPVSGREGEEVGCVLGLSSASALGPQDRTRHHSRNRDAMYPTDETITAVFPSGNGGRSESPVYTNLQELKISGSNLPPAPSTSPLHVHGDWETHKDQSGRHYYHNRSTQERTWKPPRAREASTGSRGDPHGNSTGEAETPPLSLSPSFLPLLSLSIGRFQPLSLDDNYHSPYSSQSDSQYGSPPQGWSEELDEHGHILYVSDYTNEKWIKHVDEQGRPYYYNADGSRSEWVLPKYNQSPPLPGGGDTHKSRSLDRKQVEPIVLSKWRHSTYVLDTNDKRLIKNIRRFRTGSGRPHPYRQTQVGAPTAALRSKQPINLHDYHRLEQSCLSACLANHIVPCLPLTSALTFS